MEFPFQAARTAPFPWRTAALAAAAVAAVELVVLLIVAIGATIPTADGTTTRPAATSEQKTDAAAKATSPAPAASPAATMLPRRRVSVVVLNGNGRTGAAAAASTRIRARGYRIGLVGNAAGQSYPRSLVMFKPGFAPEARRLARDLGIGQISPLDGMRPGALHGSHVVVILGG